MSANTDNWDIAVIQSPLYGGGLGASFNDVGTVAGYPKKEFGINVVQPITELKVMHGDVVDGLQLTYNKTDNQTETVSHGSSEHTNDPELKKDTVALNANEAIIAVSGKHGVSDDNPQWGERVAQMSFAIYDASTGLMRIAGPFGKGEFGQAFRSTANGKFVAVGGFAVNSNNSVGATNGNTGLYGLTFAQVAWKSLAA